MKRQIVRSGLNASGNAVELDFIPAGSVEPAGSGTRVQATDVWRVRTYVQGSWHGQAFTNEREALERYAARTMPRVEISRVTF